jgi:hypothetical protein
VVGAPRPWIRHTLQSGALGPPSLLRESSSPERESRLVAAQRRRAEEGSVRGQAISSSRRSISELHQRAERLVQHVQQHEPSSSPHRGGLARVSDDRPLMTNKNAPLN